MPIPPSLAVLSNVAFRAASVAQAAICHAIYTKQTDPVIPLSEMIFATVAAACSGPFPDPRQLDLTIGLVEPQLGGDKIRRFGCSRWRLDQRHYADEPDHDVVVV